MTTKLIVTIDTEEEGLWCGQFDAQRRSVRNIRSVPRFQAVCDALNVAPTYLVNSPVVNDGTAAAILRDIHTSGRCEIGAHIHPWNTGEWNGSVEARDSYLSNLPSEIQRTKLTIVTSEIEEAFGRRPTSFRSGRYGLDGAGLKLLQELGYIVDSSVCPFTEYTSDGGPDFRGAPFTPYRVKDDLLAPADEGAMLEVPVSFGFSGSNFEACSRLYEGIRKGPLARLRCLGLLDRLGLLQKIKFSPEQGDSKRLIRLARAYVANSAPCIVMMFHSSSLLPGQTPYVRSERDLETFLQTIRLVLEYCIHELHMQPKTLSDFAQAYLAQKETTFQIAGPI